MSDHPYSRLTPTAVMDAVESLGFLCDARVFALNSYENRVYQVGIEEQNPLIVKFYRPRRWSKSCIQEEHDFLHELKQQELPVIAPLEINNQTLFEFDGFYFSLFPRQGGHAPEISNEDDLELLGRWLGRLHLIGEKTHFKHRPQIAGVPDLELASQQVLSSGLMPDEYQAAYTSLITDLRQEIQQAYLPQAQTQIRLHGDLHSGNLLLRDENLYLVDFDDCLTGPAMQDIWMLLSGDRYEQQQQLQVICEGYEMFRPFPTNELPLIEALRTLRMIKYAAWLCVRWQDPAFPAAFPWLTSHQFWSQHTLSLREQLAALREPTIQLPNFNM
ncbi:serine/threonine protein kinase [Bacterioplanoides sp.]|uniref:serine/threonine protein kinase n=1 Tax=Bacterioplanoides sp. TaxID=2066072 RepID=UPI003AFFA961